MNKLITGLILGAFVLLSSQLAAQPVVAITPQNKQVQVNEEFTVDIVVEKFTNIASLQFPVVWNPNVIEYVGVENINSTDFSGFSENLIGYNASVPGKLTILWFEPNFAGVTLPDGTRIVTVRYRAKQNGTTQIAITEDPPGIEVTNPDEQEIGLTPRNATVQVGDGGGSTLVRLLLSDPTVEAGDEVCVQMTVQGFTNLTGLKFSLKYDPNFLEFKQARNFNGQVTGLNATAVSNPSAGTLNFDWTNAMTGITLTDGAALFELCFTTKKAGTTQVSFQNPKPVATPKTGTATVETNPGNITISEPAGGGGFQLRLNDATTQPGEMICLPVLVRGFQDIVGLQYTVRYDANLLQFVEARNFNANVPGLDANGISNPTPGTLRFQWNDGGFTGIDLSNGAVLFELCFRARSAGAASVAFSSTPLAIEVTRKVGAIDQEVIDFTTQNATVTIEGNTSGGGPGFAGFGVYMEDQLVNSGDEICIPVKVQDFQDILGLQFSFSYDKDALTLKEVRNFGLNGLTDANINKSILGVIAVQWDDPSTNGQTLADGAVILELCFTVKAKNGTATTVSFVNQPTPIEFTRKANNDIGQETIDDYNLRNARIIIGDGTQGFDGFGFLLSNATPPSGTEFCLQVSVQDFVDIVGAQFTIDYDPNVLQFIEVKNYNLSGLGEDAFGNPTPGKITFRWFDPAVAGIDLPDGTAIFDVCFRATGPNGTKTLVIFSNEPTAIEGAKKVGNTEETIDEVGFKVGIVEIGGGIPRITTESGSSVNVTNVNCFGESTGAIDIAVVGGTGAYLYHWSYQNKTTQDLSGIPAGMYTVTVTDSNNGESATGTFTVTQPNAALAVQTQVVNIECSSSGNTKGAINLTVNGGTPQYAIDWNGSLPDNVMSQTNLEAGQYSVTVTDAKGCKFNSGNLVVKELSTSQLTLTPKSVDAGNDGGITLVVNGGIAPFTYKWSGPGNFSATTKDLSGLNAIGEYCVTVTDGNGCINEQCTNLYAVLKFGQIDIVNACAGSTNGGIALTMTGGLAPYAYKWSSGNSTGATLSNVGPGTYNVTVTDGKGDKLNGSFEVTRLPVIKVDKTITPVTGVVTNKNGSIRLSVTGGRPGFTINWNSGATGTQLTNLGTGQYCATVTDQNNCSVEECYQVSFQAVPLSATATSKPVSCNGKNDGEIEVTILGGALPYEVTFPDGTRVNSTNGKATRGGLAPGEVTYTVRDANGQTIEGSVTITEPGPIRLAEVKVVHDTEDPGCSGSIRLSISGGTPAYTVVWNAPQTGAQIINLCAGPFIPSVADARGCTATFDPIELTTFGVQGEVTNTSCPTDENGVVTLTVQGGAKPYKYRWANDVGEVVGTAANLEGVVPGKYRVTVSEESGNQLVREFVIGSTSTLGVEANVLSNYQGFGVSCPDASDGRLEARGLNGIGSYNYEWTRGGEMVGTKASLANAPAGKYEVTVIDDSGCISVADVDLTAPPVIAVAADITDVSCNGSSDGEIDVKAAGGAGNNLFTFNWNTGVSGSRLRSLETGNYTVTVTDQLNCKQVKTFAVKEPKPLLVQVKTEPASEGCNGKASAIVTGGTAPYTYRWNSNRTDSVLTGLCPDTYLVIVTDSRGCKPVDSGSKTTGIVQDRRFPCMEATEVVSANNDGDNDVFKINCVEEFPNNRLEIYNRWGQLVFEQQNYDNTWEAKDTDGNYLPEGPYYFVLHYADSKGIGQLLKGSFTILREN